MQGGDENSESSDLRAHVRSMIDQEKEVSVIASSVKRIYDDSIKALVVGRVRGEDVTSPEWSEVSITRHILTSGEFPRIFSAVQRRLYESLILRQQRFIVRSDGSINEKNRKALLHTMREFSTFKVHCENEPSTKKRKV